ncbi:MAG: YcxB family protein [Dorea sp.]
MGNDNIDVQESSNVKKSKYVVDIRYDKKTLSAFVKFLHRVKHPRATISFVIIGAMMFALPFVNHEIALPGVIICLIFGPILLLLGLFRDKITIQMMKKDSEFIYNEEISYRFGNTGVEVVRNGKTENMGNYKKIFRLWEDEKYFYVNMNEDDLLVLPKDQFTVGDAQTFREFILDKSRAEFKWKPARIDNQIKWRMAQTTFGKKNEEE